MSSLPIEATRESLLDHAASASADEINARIDRLPGTRAIWTLVLLLSVGGWFEFYDLFFTAYVGPGLVKSGLYSTTTASFFGFSGLGAFVAASFAGLFVGTFCLTGLADRYGRRTMFTASLLWYSAATCIMALQTSAPAINLWRLVAGIGVGIELVTIDTYVSELVPKHLRGRAFAFVHLVQYTAVPVVAFLAWWFVPRAPFGFEGWRWVVMFGAFGALIAWAIRRRVPESARWLAQRGRTEEAARVLAQLEVTIEAQSGRPLPAPVVEPAGPQVAARARFAEIWQPPYRRRTITLLVFNLFQAIGFYGFASWVPTLLVSKGVTVTHSLLYSFVIAASNPFGPLLGMAIADRIERKTLIVLSALAIAVCGTLFAMQTSAAMLMFLGVLITLGGTLLSVGYHAYQVELFPTRMRATAVGFVYSMSRLSAMLSGFMIAFALRHFGVPGVFALITGAMIAVMAAIGIFGPRTKNRALDDISR
ncbi:MFS transporter [Paraburkholderia lycopersici]|uniref:MFS transporter, putative metabolite:H+ symporter n=1 Tax=Paraburkholderia lycopersici TaxID=416944 RepID=A0A1G6UU13_9BURK|nr:MFS transporter [Paraburkholderia lycopersici]SDD44792.1 MFS transporter, putative metabolite:H+ symporter [Paraburkholderia lycopersici]